MEGFLLFLAFLVVVGFPSANLQVFDGLPFSRLFEFGALVLIVPFLIFPDLRNRQMIFWKGLKIRPVFLWTSLAVLLLLKGTLLASGAHAGFSACYRSPAEPTTITHEDLPPRDCERSYENLFDRFSATRTDSAVWFAPDTWNLVFLNTNRYNYYDWEAGNILRDRIPLQARWSGVPEFKPGDTIRIEYVGQGTIAWGGTQIPLPPSYAAPSVVEFTAPPIAAALQIDYTFDDGSRSGQDPQSWGPRATIKVSAGKPGSMVPLAAQSAAPGWKAAALLADALILLWLCSFLPGLWTSVGSDLLALIVFAMGAGVISLIPIPALIREIGITAALAVFLTVHLAVRPFRPATVYFSAIVAAFLILRVWSSGGAGQVLLRSAGNDPLVYESQAYSILVTNSLRGGESVFYYQPMYRYVKFLEHAIFGDGNMLYASLQLAAYFGGVFWLYQTVGVQTDSLARRILLVGLGCGLIILGGYYISGIIRDGLSEYDTWILLLWVLPGLFLEISSLALLAGTAALTISYMIRPDQISGILWILCLAAIGSWRRHKRVVLLAGTLALGFFLLPLIHNLYFGHQWVVATTSGAHSANLTLPPSTWLAFLRGEPDATMTVREQIGMLFLITNAPRSMLPILATMALFLITWIVTAAYFIYRRQKRIWLLLALPLLYLAPHFFYQVNTYYPRLIVIAYLSMAYVVVIALVSERKAPPNQEGTSSAVELLRK
jgi:hypothetical protein